MVNPTESYSIADVEIDVGIRDDSSASFLCRMFLLMLLLVPIAYSGLILGTAVHEILGHGLVAWLLGGQFVGFVVRLDGMGWALAGPADNAPLWHSVLILAGGLLASFTVGLWLFVLAMVCSKRWLIHATLLVLATCTLLDSAAYLFWSALHPGTQGDFAQIYELTQSDSLRWAMVICGALLTILCTVTGFAFIYRSVERWLAHGNRLSGRRRVLALFVFVFLPNVLGYYTFDWNQTVEGIGMLPSHTNLLFTCIFCPLLYWCSPRPTQLPRRRAGMLWPILGAWFIAAAILGSILVWFSEGVYWF